ncbi:MAG: hypothetical protein A4E51_00627 [Methanosaeta sp. PtaU1.Bin055]|nr:MAG: hypothetical protein A4E51_00627 [Methanosaeta sp. PtaU1.Bin055]
MLGYRDQVPSGVVLFRYDLDLEWVADYDLIRRRESGVLRICHLQRVYSVWGADGDPVPIAQEILVEPDAWSDPIDVIDRHPQARQIGYSWASTAPGVAEGVRDAGHVEGTHRRRVIDLVSVLLKADVAYEYLVAEEGISVPQDVDRDRLSSGFQAVYDLVASGRQVVRPNVAGFICLDLVLAGTGQCDVSSISVSPGGISLRPDGDGGALLGYRDRVPRGVVLLGLHLDLEPFSGDDVSGSRHLQWVYGVWGADGDPISIVQIILVEPNAWSASINVIDGHPFPGQIGDCGTSHAPRIAEGVRDPGHVEGTHRRRVVDMVSVLLESDGADVHLPAEERVSVSEDVNRDGEDLSLLASNYVIASGGQVVSADVPRLIGPDPVLARRREHYIRRVSIGPRGVGLGADGDGGALLRHHHLVPRSIVLFRLHLDLEPFSSDDVGGSRHLEGINCVRRGDGDPIPIAQEILVEPHVRRCSVDEVDRHPQPREIGDRRASTAPGIAEGVRDSGHFESPQSRWVLDLVSVLLKPYSSDFHFAAEERGGVPQDVDGDVHGLAASTVNDLVTAVQVKGGNVPVLLGLDPVLSGLF